MFLPLLSPHVEEGRGGPSTRTGSSSPKMQLRLNSNLHRESKTLLQLLLREGGRAGSCSTGSPPPPSQPPPPTPPHTLSVVSSALLLMLTFVDRPVTTKCIFHVHGSYCQMKVLLFCKEYKRYSLKLKISVDSLFNLFTLKSKYIFKFVLASIIGSVAERSLTM